MRRLPLRTFSSIWQRGNVLSIAGRRTCCAPTTASSTAAVSHGSNFATSAAAGSHLDSPLGTRIAQVALDPRTNLPVILVDKRNSGMAAPAPTDVSNPSPSDAPIRFRGRVQHVRIRGKLAFVHLRQPNGGGGGASTQESIQVVFFGGSTATEEQRAAFVKVKESLTPESVVDVYGTLARASEPIRTVSCSDVEVHASRLCVLSLAASPLPFPLADTRAKLDTRLNHRSLDLRTPLMGAVTSLVSTAGNAFRSYMHDGMGFVEIHTPKLIASASEGGSAIFHVDYFGQPAFLAQSPQLYKQMALMGDIASRGVFEVGPVFRAEKSLTHRHLTEFVGLDVEMLVESSHTEVLTVLEGTIAHILESLAAQPQHIRVAQEAMAAMAAAGSVVGNGDRLSSWSRDPIVVQLSQETIHTLGIGNVAEKTCSSDPYGATVGGSGCAPAVLRFSFDSAIQMLLDAKVLEGSVDDLTSAQERQLGALIKARYGVDVYVVDCFPSSVRPFYTMPHPNKPQRTCSYDMYLRGEEICSGAQRQHDAAALQARVEELGPETAAALKDYIDAFRSGAWPHGGFGLGLERIVMFFLGLPDIRLVSMFPRDPRRIRP